MPPWRSDHPADQRGDDRTRRAASASTCGPGHGAAAASGARRRRAHPRRRRARPARRADRNPCGRLASWPTMRWTASGQGRRSSTRWCSCTRGGARSANGSTATTCPTPSATRSRPPSRSPTWSSPGCSTVIPAYGSWPRTAAAILPTYLGRSDHAWQVRPEAQRPGEPPSTYMRRMWFDSLVYTPRALASPGRRRRCRSRRSR